jgi:DNA (cytosine-5)-methyltransferase 1
MKPNPEKPSLVSLFSGGGGLDLGLEAAGFETLYASDIDFHSCRTLQAASDYSQRKGLPFLSHAIVEQADVCELDGNVILEKIGKKRGEVGVLAGGPPCQAFSVFGKRAGRADPRGQLPAQYIRLLNEIAPKAFVFENVYGLLTIEGGQVFEELCEELSHPSSDLTYKLSVFRVNASHYGVPQKRDRVIIIGSRDGITVPEIPRVTSADESSELMAIRTVEQALRGLPAIGVPGVSNHVGRVHSERIIERYTNLTFGERDSKTRINKLDPKKPSFTIIVGSDKGGGKGHVHPFEPREVTPRESARIQTFPDWWSFSGTSRHPIRQVGNAVPPLLAAAIGKTLSEQLFGRQAPAFLEMAEMLGQGHLFEEERAIEAEVARASKNFADGAIISNVAHVDNKVLAVANK